MAIDPCAEAGPLGSPEERNHGMDACVEDPSWELSAAQESLGQKQEECLDQDEQHSPVPEEPGESQSCSQEAEEEDEIRFSEGMASHLQYAADNVVAAINAGGPDIPETTLGVGFLADHSFSGGDVLRTGEEIVDAQEPSLYRTARYGEVTYRITGLSVEDHLVDVHFAEIIFTNGPPGMRIFDVYIQDEKVVADLDIYARVGSNRPLILPDVRTTVKDGSLSISFRGVVGNPTISAICVRKAPPVETTSGKCRPPLPLTSNEERCHESNVSEERKLTRQQQMKDKARGVVREYEQKLEELKNECHEAWLSVQDTNRLAEKLRDELSVKSLTVDTLANVVENQVIELRDIKEREAKQNENSRSLLLEVVRKQEELKLLHSSLSEEAKDCICSFPDPRNMISAVQCLVNEHQDLKKKYHEECQERKYLYNKVIELRGNVRVYCRCRPLSKSESEASSQSVVDFETARENEIVVHSIANGRKHFKFDRVFTPEDDQAKVFEDTAPVVVSVLDGYNVCIFAYGQTGTGKTFTMEGVEGSRGVNYRTLEELFRIASLRKGEINYEIFVSVLEVYNEQIRDLLSPVAQASKKLEIKQVAEGGHHVPGLVEAQVHSMAEVWEVLQSGSSARAVGSTNANEHSSRSHCMLWVKVKGENMTTGECTRSKLWLIDLAGSERIAKSDVQGHRLKEAQNINKSLAALGDVINALTTKSSHVPYRNSKLTHLLQDSLGGEAKTLMFVQISPSETDLPETLCSLNFASRVRGIELGPIRKQVDSAEFLKYKQMAEKSKQEVKLKDEALRKLEENLRNAEKSLRMKEQMCQSLAEKVRERENAATELEQQLANEKKARALAEARPRLPLQDRSFGKDAKLGGAGSRGATSRSDADNENIDPQRPASAPRKLSLARAMPPPKFMLETPSNDPSAAWKGVDVPSTMSRMRQLRKVHFNSPLMRSRDKTLLEAKKAAAAAPPVHHAVVAAAHHQQEHRPLPAARRRISMAGRAWGRLSGVNLGGAQRVPSGRKSMLHQRERGWNK